MSDDEYHYSDYEEEANEELQVLSNDSMYEIETPQHSYVKDNRMFSSGNSTSTLSDTRLSSHESRRYSSTVGIDKLVTRRIRRDEYRVIDEEELVQQQEKFVDEVAQVVQVSSAVACILLQHYGWNKEKLYENYFLNPTQAKKAIGIEYVGTEASPVVGTETVDCLICCESYSGKEVFGMGCGHLYCLNCWQSYLSLKILEGPSSISTTCPSHGCKEVVNRDIVRNFVSPDDYERYRRYLLRSYVQINKCVKWCPSPGCNKAISSGGGLLSVSCTCGCVFCLRCGEESHAPVTCVQLAAWQEKCRNESETANWILVNTKKCPKCSVRIEKNHGCNHMICKSCTYEFCWICLESWKKHGAATGGYYKCNRYESQGAPADTDAARAKAELDRYLHYYQRYANHSEAGKFSARMREGTESRMMQFQAAQKHASWIDVQFLNTSTEQLIECRRVLKYTYVLGYYLPSGKEKDLFEYLQENLEKNTEHLTGLMESPIETMDRSDIINYTRVTETFLRNLLAGVEDGLTSNAPSIHST